MFENATDELAEALSAVNEPIPLDEAREIVSDSSIVAEGAINNNGVTAEYQGVEYLTGVEGGPSYDVGDIGSDSSEGSESGSEEVEPSGDPNPSPEPATSSDASGGVQWDSSEGLDTYDVNGIRIASDPEEHLVGDRTGEDHYGLPKLTNGIDKIPNEPKSYMPIPLGGGRDSEEIIGRVLGELNRPLLLEGEAGTGKNLVLDVFGYESKRPKYRVNFGTDVSVFDLVGEKDIRDGESYYILGKMAKPAMFGGLVILDEVNMASGDTSSFLHGIAEEPGSRSLELRGTGRTLTDIPVSQDEIERYGSWYDAARKKWDSEKHLGRYIHPEFRVAATCNPLGYADTKPMNSAFRDRFVVLQHPYLTQVDGSSGPSSDSLSAPSSPAKGVKREAALLTEETGVPEREAQALVDFVAMLREARRQANAISCPITHRSLLKTVELAGPKEEFMPLVDALKLVLEGHAATKQDKQYVRDAIADEL